jgi:hypothetical protein
LVTKRRSPALAALASFFLPGLGQLYNGQPMLFAAWLTGYFLAAIFYTVRLFGVILSDNPAAEMTSVFVPLALMGLIWLSSVVHAIFGALNQSDYELQSYNRGLVYLGSVLFAYLLLPAAISIPLVKFAMKQHGITTPEQANAAMAKFGKLGLGGMVARAARPEEGPVDLKIDIPDPDSMAALATTVFHISLVGGQDGGIYDANSNEIVCTHRSSTSQPSWAGLYANPGDTAGLTAVQFRVPIDEGETNDFQLSINRGSGAESRSYVVDGRRPWGENGKGRAQVERRGGSAVIRIDAATAEGVRVEAVVQCKRVAEE